jgi:DNA polymerase I-like protein with 3'-5' exonuclease and polymerase domains
MRLYFQHITENLQDDRNREKYAYTSPLGTVRRGCSFCAAANGLGMQTTAAEGASLMIVQLTRECFDHTLNSVLHGCFPVDFIHDEALVEVPIDRAEECVKRIETIFVETMGMVIPGVKIKAAGAIMRRWYKEAEPVYVDGKLVPWEPKKVD